MQSTEPDIAAATVALLLREKLLQAEVLANQLTKEFNCKVSFAYLSDPEISKTIVDENDEVFCEITYTTRL